jgi:glycosyltransferase involved in cell wall biosynthesis
MINSIVRKALRKPGEPLHILNFPAHERYESMLAKSGHTFYDLPSAIKWNEVQDAYPNNHIPIEGIPWDIDFDLILCGVPNLFANARKLAREQHLPIVILYLFVPPPGVKTEALEAEKNSVAPHEQVVFLNEPMATMWGWKPKERGCECIELGLDTSTFKIDENAKRENRIISVVNDWKNRDWSHGYTLWLEVTKGFNTRPLGKTPGVSEEVPLDQLVKEYQRSRIYINTGTGIVTSYALIEAMACGCAPVVSNQGDLKNIVEHGKTGYVCDSKEEFRKYLKVLTEDEVLATNIGKQASSAVSEKYGIDRFLKKWDTVLSKTSKKVYIG